jgi:hypothetical protein
MRDHSWGPRYERGYHRVGYSWAASADRRPPHRPIKE